MTHKNIHRYYTLKCLIRILIKMFHILDMQPGQGWAPQEGGIGEHGLNNIPQMDDNLVVAQIPAI